MSQNNNERATVTIDAESSRVEESPTMPRNRAEMARQGVLIAPADRLAAKEAIRLKYVSGRATLARLSVEHRIPYDTVQRWSKEEDWRVTKHEVGVRSDRIVTEKATEWLVAEREGQIRAILDEAKAARELLASVRAEGDTYFHPETGVIRGPIGATGAAKLAGAGKAIAETVMQALGIGNQNAKGGTTINVQAVGTAMVIPPE